MKKADVERRYDCGVYRPTINVKWHPWPDTMIRKFKGVQKRSKNLCRVCNSSRHEPNDHEFRPGGLYFVHEFGDLAEDAGFWNWFEGWAHDLSAWDYPNGPFCIAEEIARESGWELAQEGADWVWENTRYTPKVWGSGRSGGWLVVEGLPPVEDWDLMDLNRWSRYASCVRGILDDLDYQFVWHAHVNVFENWMANIA